MSATRAQNLQVVMNSPLPHAWKGAFERYGEVPDQSPEFLLAALHQHGRELHIIDTGPVLSAFVVYGVVATCIIEGAGVLRTDANLFDARWFLVEAATRLGVKALYFPLLYPDLESSRLLLDTPGSLMLGRRPSPVIDWGSRGQDLWERCLSRLGSRARRRWNAFERRGLSTTTLECEAAVAAVDQVERASWKAFCGQDMHSRGQFEYYRFLILSGAVDLRAVHQGSVVIAYRIDRRVRDTVFCLKWSYNEAHRVSSPGFALIARDLEVCYKDHELKQIDLFGSPDHLKDAVGTGSRARIDLAWPPCAEVEELLKERAAHDLHNDASYRAGLGIRAPYQRSR